MSGARTDGWVEWAGGEHPDLPLETVVAVLFADGVKLTDTVGYWAAENAEQELYNLWKRWPDDPNASIVAYRLSVPA